VGSLEAGSAFERLEDARLEPSATGGLAFDSSLGPAFIGFSVANGGATRFLFALGRLFQYPAHRPANARRSRP
jgi:hypothetical protein